MRKSCGVLTVLLAVLAAACSGGSAKDVASPGASNIPAPQQSAVTELPAATSTPTAMEIIDGVAVRTLTVGAPVPLPEGYVFYEVQWSWEGPAVAMQSTYRDPSGVTRVDLLYQTKLVFPSGGSPSGPAISSVAAMPDGRALAIGVCQGFCLRRDRPYHCHLVVRWRDHLVRGWDRRVEQLGGERRQRRVARSHRGDR